MSTIYDRIVELRRDKGLPTTQVEIAKAHGVEQPTVNYWKSGGGMKENRAVEIANTYGCCIAWLLTGEGAKYPDSPEVEEILERLRAVSPELREKFLAILDALD